MQCYLRSVRRPQENHTHRHLTSPGTDTLLMGIPIFYPILLQILSWRAPESTSCLSTQCRKTRGSAMATRANRTPLPLIRSLRITRCLRSKRQEVCNRYMTKTAFLSKSNSTQILTKGFFKPTRTRTGLVIAATTSRLPVLIA